ncbi:hypothetical protein [Clostridium omnivorum]|uniref:Oligosaccharide repeat unit polymerase n=1 Tax=Clostridium omnivorum TaxID=1604902 RepID=A0ABQ5N3E5_9CLOT|nr:hypothetical protein [Clostridium sp. E14]GLC29729.1 hypothetical protein bsdE14_11390 [Clostridium sp. E14]
MEKYFDYWIITIYAIFSAAFILYRKSLFMYVPFVIIMFNMSYSYLKYRKLNLITTLVILAAYSCILPDNYIIIFISFFILLYYLYKQYKNEGFKNKKTIALFIVLFIVNCIFSSNKLINIVFFVIFNFTFILYFFVFKDRSKLEIYNTALERCINNIVVIEVLTTVLIILFRFKEVLSDLGGDWSTGTLGTSQGSILMLMLSFVALRYLGDYREKKQKHKLFIVILCGIICMSTASISNNIVLIATIFLYILTFIFKDFKGSIKYITFILVIIITFIIVMPAWVKKDLYNLTNKQYAYERVKKLNTYETTFVTIPANNIKFALLGNGAGFYSSRAALTTTGNYVKTYLNVFPISMSDYTKIYIYDKLIDKNFDGSILSAPYSSIISIMGEFGMIGLLIFIAFMFYIFKHVKNEGKAIIIFFVLICFFENWIEFAKVVMFFWMFLFNDYKKDETNSNAKIN